MLADNNFIIAVVFLFLFILNTHKPHVAISALICAGVAASVLFQLLPVWSHAVAAIAFLLINGLAYLFVRR